METKLAITALAALAQESRLAIFRLLVALGPEGLAASKIAEQLGVPASVFVVSLKRVIACRLDRGAARWAFYYLFGQFHHDE